MRYRKLNMMRNKRKYMKQLYMMRYANMRYGKFNMMRNKRKYMKQLYMMKYTNVRYTKSNMMRNECGNMNKSNREYRHSNKLGGVSRF